jgi:hypothetical protein
LLWRQTYITPVFKNVALPFCFDPDVSIVLVLLTLESLPEADLWRRLIKAELPNAAFQLILNGGPTASRLQSVLPPSQRAAVAATPDIEWQNIVEVDQTIRALALVVCGSTAKVVMVGPPTEDAWDLFRVAVES